MNVLSTTQAVGGTMTDEQKRAIDHAQKILRAVKLYLHADLLAALSASIADTAVAKPVLAWLVDPGEGSAMDKLQRDEPCALQMMDIKRRGGSVTPLVAATPAPSVADYAALHLTPEQAAKEAK